MMRSLVAFLVVLAVAFACPSEVIIIHLIASVFAYNPLYLVVISDWVQGSTKEVGPAPEPGRQTTELAGKGSCLPNLSAFVPR